MYWRGTCIEAAVWVAPYPEDFCSYRLLHCFIWRDAVGYLLRKTLLGAAQLPRRSALLTSSICLSLPFTSSCSFIPCINPTADSFHHHNNRFLRNLQHSSLARRVPGFQTGFQACPWSRPAYLMHLSLKNCLSPTNFTRHRSTCFSCPAPLQHESAMYWLVLVCQKLPPQCGSVEEVRPKRWRLELGSYAVNGIALGKDCLLSQST